MPPFLPFYYLCHFNPHKIIELLSYFYHPDPASTKLSTSLGSSNWITDGSGNAIQHLHYLPFGEDWVDQRNSSWNAPYTFSGKEKDVETGYGYFGARYYNSDLSIWLSVDPMSDKYPNMSPYNYCANNPVILVDPDGRTPKIYIETTGLTGHAFITVGEGKNTVVYTYGRYLGGDKGKSSANSLDPSGQGVLIKLTGKEAQRYIRHQLKDKNAKAYEITDASDQKVMEYFDKIFSQGRKLNSEEANSYNSKSTKYGNSDDARVIDNYDLLNNNCVDMTTDGAKAGGTNEDFNIDTSGSLLTPNIQKRPTLTPGELKGYLQRHTQYKNSNVKDVTKKMTKEFCD